MNLTIDFVSELESRLLEVAAQQGIDPGQYVVNAVRERLKVDSLPRLSAEHSRLLDDINRGLSQQEWNRYHELVEKRRGEVISNGEYAELVATSDSIEVLNAQRMERLTELAALRGMSLPALMEQLGISQPSVM